MAFTVVRTFNSVVQTATVVLVVAVAMVAVCPCFD